MNYWKQFKPKACSVHLKATSKEAALAEVVENMVLAEVLSRDLAGEAEEGEPEGRGDHAVGEVFGKRFYRGAGDAALVETVGVAPDDF